MGDGAMAAPEAVQAGAASLPGSERREFRKFVKFLYDRAELDDLQNYDVHVLQGIALSFWRFTECRKPGMRLVRVFNPRMGEHGWESADTMIDIVSDDMPFLIDSVLGELNDMGLGINAILHPIVEVRRDSEGRRTGIEAAELTEGSERAARIAREKGYVRESIMHLEIDHQYDSEVRDEIRSRVLKVLSDVAIAVQDWEPMRARMAQIIAEFNKRPPKSCDPEEWTEVADFLKWLDKDRFAFLGMRDYEVLGGVETGELRAVPDSGLGLLRDPGTHVLRRRGELVAMTPEIREFLKAPQPLIVTKANVRSTVHRRVYMDYVGIKIYGSDGSVVGERRLVGLFTAVAYNRSVWNIPLLKRKARLVLERGHLPPGAHDERAVVNILENFPRDELFQVSEDELLRTALGILRLQKRPRTKIFVRHDRFDRFVSVLVFVPRDRYDTDVRIKIGDILTEAFDGRLSAFYPAFGDGPLARVHFIIGRNLSPMPDVDLDQVERRIEEVARDWRDDLRQVLEDRHGGMRARLLYERYGRGFDAAYRDAFRPEEACADIDLIEELEDEPAIALSAGRGEDDEPHMLHVKLFHWNAPVPLSDVLPVFENMGLRVLDEAPYTIEIRRDTGATLAGVNGSGRSVWIHNFRMEHIQRRTIGIPRRGGAFERAFQAVWFGAAENDGFNRLIVEQALDWRDVVILRAFARFLRLAGQSHSLGYMQDVFSSQGAIAHLLIDLFKQRFDPSLELTMEERRAQQEGLRAQINNALEQVESLDADRIIRNVAHLIISTRRTNYFQADESGAPPTCLALKISSRKIDILPPPRPFAEIYVYSPRVEGVHLRQGKVARGGIRWSDRREDFRTEVLGLVKAQQVKNAIIVPVGAKGGFVPKHLPEFGTREEILAEAVACYRIFVSALLDLTDNLVDGVVVKPPRTVAYDGSDPYLVVAADKGTATFSDIANGIAQEHGFWLGDAFASGGSRGYDHKKMAITARGAWVAVQRHFRELGIDIQSTSFTAAGVGDMSGDVFGNAMLRSPATRLVAAFDHRDIFLDPDPDPEASFAERQRLFDLPRSSWADYDRTLISEGGGVFSRSRKSIPLSPQLRKLLDLDRDDATPGEVIRAILTARVDLLWFGGIGTYVKASGQSQFDVGDPANDAIRVNACDVRAKVVGEGANLGLTQLGRVEFARMGGRINTDAVDNAAGVDCSDHEVNIKIALDSAVRAGRLDVDARNALLERMTEDVAALVLKDIYRQTLALTVAEAQARRDIDAHGRFMRILERGRLLDRHVESLPDDETLQELKDKGFGLTRPEISVLLAYSKITLFDELVNSSLPDDPYLEGELADYFPQVLAREHRDAISGHSLRREIIATTLANDLVNKGGLTFVNRTRENLGHSAASITRCYVITREVFGLRGLYDRINALDLKIPAETQTHLHTDVMEFLRGQVLWFLRYCVSDMSIGDTIARYRTGVSALGDVMEDLLAPFVRKRFRRQLKEWTAAGAPSDLAREVAVLEPLSAACDLVDIANACRRPVDETARAYFRMGEFLGLDRLRVEAAGLSSAEHWDRLSVKRNVEELFRHQRELTVAAIVQAQAGAGGAAAVDAWAKVHAAAVDRAVGLIGEMAAAGPLTGAKLALAVTQIRELVRSPAGATSLAAARAG